MVKLLGYKMFLCFSFVDITSFLKLFQFTVTAVVSGISNCCIFKSIVFIGFLILAVYLVDNIPHCAINSYYLDTQIENFFIYLRSSFITFPVHFLVVLFGHVIVGHHRH
jgi:hypothetical protein